MHLCFLEQLPSTIHITTLSIYCVYRNTLYLTTHLESGVALEFQALFDADSSFKMHGVQVTRVKKILPPDQLNGHVHFCMSRRSRAR